MVCGWGWLESSAPDYEAQLAVDLCRRFDLDGYIGNAETAYEFAGAWKSKVFVDEFRLLAPRAPLALSYIGDGYPYRQLDWTPWVKAGAAFMPQCYWSTSATSIVPARQAAQRAGLPLAKLCYTLGTSGFEFPYPATAYRDELVSWAGNDHWNVWLLESTQDDYLRALLS